MNYYKQVITDPKNKRYLEVVAVCRTEIGEGGTVSDRYDPGSGDWEFDPEVLGAASGLTGSGDYKRIDQSEVEELIKNLAA